MTPAEDPSAGAANIAERAELHLRLLAETELRHALSLPRYEQPLPRDFAAPLLFAARAIRPIAAAAGQITRPLAQATRMKTSRVVARPARPAAQADSDQTADRTVPRGQRRG